MMASSEIIVLLKNNSVFDNEKNRIYDCMRCASVSRQCLTFSRTFTITVMTLSFCGVYAINKLFSHKIFFCTSKVTCCSLGWGIYMLRKFNNSRAGGY